MDSKYKIFGLVLCAGLVCSCGLAKQKISYDSIQLAYRNTMKITDFSKILEEFSREPDVVLNIDEEYSYVLYSPVPEQLDSLESLSAIPYIYSSAEYIIDSESTVVARNLVGESGGYVIYKGDKYKEIRLLDVITKRRD